MNLAIQDKIHKIRSRKIILAEDLALLYGVTSRLFSKAVKQHMDSLTGDGIILLTDDEYYSIRPRLQARGKSHTPWAFTKHGVITLAGILKNEKLIRMDPDFTMRHFIILYHLHTEYAVWSAH